MRNTMRRRVITAVTISSALVLSAAPAAPAAVPTGRLAGFTQIVGGWQLVPPDPDPGDPTSTACQPDLSVENGEPVFTLRSLGGSNYYEMHEAAEAAAYVARWDCDSVAVIGAFRIVDEGVALGGPQSSRWTYAYGRDLVHGFSEQVVSRRLFTNNPVSGVVHVQTGAWWGKPHPTTGQMVYYPAGCFEDVWMYTVAAHDGAVPAQNLDRDVPCMQPPLPGMPELL